MSSVRTHLYNERVTLGRYDDAGDYIEGWADVYDDATRAMCHVIRGPIPAQDVYALLGPLSAGTQRLPQVLAQISRGLSESLSAYEVVDTKRNPAESVADATAALALAVSSIENAVAALDAAHVAINEQYGAKADT